MKRLTDAVISTLQTKMAVYPSSHKLKIGLIFKKNVALALKAAAISEVLVLSNDKFRPLYNFSKRNTVDSAGIVPVEARFEYLPFGQGTLDILIIAEGFPGAGIPVANLKLIKHHMKPGGTIIWSTPILDGFWGRCGRIAAKLRPNTATPVLRHKLCSMAMEVGLQDVEQAVCKGKGPFPWGITTGSVGENSITIDKM